MLPFIDRVVVGSITSTIRNLPTEVPVGVAEGLDHESVVSLDNVNTVQKVLLHDYVGTLSEERMRQVCLALADATGCTPDA